MTPPRLLLALLLASLAALPARANVFKAAAQCLATGGPLSALKENASDLKKVAVFSVNHPVCLGKLIDEDYVLYALSAGFDIARVTNKYPAVFASEDTCKQMVDGPLQSLAARVLQDSVGKLLPADTQADLAKAGADQLKDALRDVPGLDSVFEDLDCGCAVAFSGLGIDNLKQKAKVVVAEVESCYEFAGDVIGGFISAGEYLARFIGVSSCPHKLTGDDYLNQVYGPLAEQLALAPQVIIDQWKATNLPQLKAACFSYFNGGSSDCRMSTDNATDTCNTLEQQLTDRIQLRSTAMKAQRSFELDGAMSYNHPPHKGGYAKNDPLDLFNGWNKKCDQLETPWGRGGCKSAVVKSFRLAAKAAHVALRNNGYDVEAALQTYRDTAALSFDNSFKSAQQVDHDAFVGQNLQTTDKAAEAWRQILIGLWAPKCTDTACIFFVILQADGMKAEMLSMQDSSPDLTSLAVFSAVSLKGTPVFQGLVDTSVARKKVYEKNQAADRSAFNTSVLLSVKGLTPSCPKGACVSILQSRANDLRKKFDFKYVATFRQYDAPNAANRPLFVSGEAKLATATLEKELARAQLSDSLHKKAQQLAAAQSEATSELLQKWCDKGHAKLLFHETSSMPIAKEVKSKLFETLVQGACEAELFNAAFACAKKNIPAVPSCPSGKGCPRIAVPKCDPLMDAELGKRLGLMKQRTQRLAARKH